MTLLSDVEAAENEAAASMAAPRGVLKVTAPIEFGNLYIAPLIPEFMNAYPDIDLNLDFSNRNVNIVEEGYDLAIRVARSFDTSLMGRRIALSRFHIVASPAYLQRHGWPETPDMLAGHACLSFGVPSPWDEWTLTRNGETKRVRVKSRLVSTSAETLLLAARGGTGITWLPSFICGQDLREGRLVSLFPDHYAGALEIYVLHPHRRFVPTKVRVLIDFLMGRFNADDREDPWG